MPRQFDSLALTLAVALMAPAVRIVVVNAWCFERADGPNETGHELLPVLGLSARVAASFSRAHVPNDWRRPPTIASAVRDGWCHDGTDATFDAIVIDPESGRIGPADEMLSAENEAHAVAACPWPPEEDEVRLAGVIARVEREAVANVTRRRSKAVA